MRSFCELQEKEWLRSFYYDVEKCIRQNESDAEFVEVCFSALQQIKQIRNGQDEKPDPEVSSCPWLPLDHQVVSLDTVLRKEKDVFGGSLVCSTSQTESISGKSINFGESV